MELTQSLCLCKFCLNHNLTSLQESILKLHRGAVSNVQNHMKNCHSKEYQQSSDNQSDSLPNKKQNYLECSFSMTKQKEHTL